MQVINESFENWENNIPVNWTKVNNTVGSNTNTVTIVNEKNIVQESINSVRLITSNPSVGIEQTLNITEEKEINIPINTISGQAFVHLAKLDGTNINVTTEKQSNWGETNTNGYRSVRLNNGDWAKFFTLTSNAETSNNGAIYISRNGNTPTKVYNESGVQQGVTGFLQYADKEIIICIKVIADGICSPYIIESTDSFVTVTRNMPLVTNGVSTDIQCYNGIICKDGRTILPYVAYVGNKYELDIIYSDDNLTTWNILGQYKNSNTTRGLMEPKAVQINDTTVAILSRSEEGHLLRNDLDLTTMTLGECQITNIATSSTTFTIKTLLNGTHVLAWNAVNKNNGGNIGANYPREIICLGFLSSDLSEINNISVLATNQSINGTMASGIPYIHSPVICIDKNNLDDIYVYFESIYSETITYTYEVKGKISILNGTNTTVTKSIGEWENLKMTLPIGNYKLQLLSGITATSEFVVDNITELSVDVISAMNINIDGNTIAILKSNSDSNLMLKVKLLDEIINIDLSKTYNNFVNINGYQYEIKIFIDSKINNLPIKKI